MIRRRVVVSIVVLASVACVSVRPAPGSKPVTQAVAPAPAAAAKAPSAAKTPIASGDTTPLPPQAVVAVSTDTGVIDDLIEEGTNNSHVAADLAYLSDVIGPRLTGSAELRRANDWTKAKFLEYGVDSAWTESWKFGRGWHSGACG
jgi:hypothetical protein